MNNHPKKVNILQVKPNKSFVRTPFNLDKEGLIFKTDEKWIEIGRLG